MKGSPWRSLEPLGPHRALRSPRFQGLPITNYKFIVHRLCATLINSCMQHDKPLDVVAITWQRAELHW